MLERATVSSAPFFQEHKPLWSRQSESSSPLDQAEFSWKMSVVEFVKEVPPFMNGELQYIFYGGTAVFIHTDGKTQTRPNLPRRHFPPDRDVVAKNKRLVRILKEEFDADARWLGYWIGGRPSLSATEEVKKKVWQSFTMVDVLGVPVPVATKPALAVSKLTSLKEPKTNKVRLPRDKDFNDVILLGVPLDEIKREYKLWGGNPNNLYIPDFVAATL